MNLEDAIKQVDADIGSLSDIVTDRLVIASNDASALIISRVRETGKDDTGNPFQPDYTPAYKRKKAGLTVKKIKRAEKRLTARLESGELGKKKSDVTLLNTAVGIRGKYRGYVDFTFTGRMLNNVGITEEKQTEKAVRIVIAPRSDENKTIFEANAKRRGQILALSKEELSKVSDAFYQGVEKQISKLLK